MNPQVTEIYNTSNDIFGYPQLYKNIPIYPIKLKDIKYHDLYYKIFTYPKLFINDAQVLKMSYLKYILFVVQYNINPTGIEMQEMVVDFLQYITKVNDISIMVKENPNIQGLGSVSLKIKLDDKEITERDFDNLREIILEQNGLSIDYIESYNPEFEKILMSTNRRDQGLTLTDEIFTFCSLTNISIKEIEEYTIYQFKLHMEKMLTLKEYDLYKPLLVSGQITLKSGDIKHYLYRSKKSGRYDSILISKEDFVNGQMFKDLLETTH